MYDRHAAATVPQMIGMYHLHSTGLLAHVTCRQQQAPPAYSTAAYQEVLLILSSSVLWKNRGAPSLGLYTHWWYCLGVNLPTCALNSL